MLIQEKLKPFDSTQLVALSIAEIAAWRGATGGCRLYLPPIQRSVVWSNEQVVNYWDSLLRGYPAGMMMIHRAVRTGQGASRKGLDAEGHTREVDENDYQLFDGQQRMAAVLLGLGDGQLKATRRLWVDLGVEPKAQSGLKFQLRITTQGQPFGYRPEAPNQKYELSKRQEHWAGWLETTGHPRREAFARVDGAQLIDARCALPLAELCALLEKHGVADGSVILDTRPGILPGVAAKFMAALDKARRSQVVLQRVAPEIVTDEAEYIRFFARLGQGGARLSDDELTYSIIKHQEPEIRDHMEAIAHGPAGRLAGEVDLVLATLRVARTCAPWAKAKAKDWEIIGRPSPAFVSQLRHDEKGAPIRRFFRSLILPGQPNHPNLQQHLEGLRRALEFDPAEHPTGLPAVLLGRIPAELLDVLLLISIKCGAEPAWLREDKELLTAFTLHWLLFVGNDAGAAWQVFLQVKEADWCWSRAAIAGLIQHLQSQGLARHLPRLGQLAVLREGIVSAAANPHLRPWSERFKEPDRDDEHPPGEALRLLSTNNELIKRALLWLQRGYITQSFDYDPTSGRDEDLPIDLDHIIPNSLFGFHWSNRDQRLDEVFRIDESALENFRWQRGVVGNSLGNFRWLDAATNRGRGNGEYVPLNQGADLVDDPAAWNSLIPRNSQRPWNAIDIGRFQALIDLRTLQLYERLVVEGGIAGIAALS